MRSRFGVVIDPFESDTARAADLWLRPRPGTDSLLAMGLMRASGTRLPAKGWRPAPVSRFPVAGS